jgi:hypothetical protein
LFGALAPVFGDLGADRQAKLRRKGRLDGNCDDDDDDGQPGEADAEPDGQLVQADADSEPGKSQSMAGGYAGCLTRPSRLPVSRRTPPPSRRR